MGLVGLLSEVDALGDEDDDGWPPVELLPGGGFGAELSEAGGVALELPGEVVVVSGGVGVTVFGGGVSLRGVLGELPGFPPGGGAGCPPPGCPPGCPPG
ncbi:MULTISPECIES: hypothetical protein [Actinomycetes]|uniref:hypothetical protein n=1 Tax=Actinomycetes TaxID=1760 RepID=UPI0001B57FD0|nr:MULTISPECIES: hypothetical protein [Actinomycetes]EFL05841.1 predicted protein [Streptomyces sp. AA4]